MARKPRILQRPWLAGTLNFPRNTDGSKISFLEHFWGRGSDENLADSALWPIKPRVRVLHARLCLSSSNLQTLLFFKT